MNRENYSSAYDAELEAAWDFLVSHDIATTEELQLITSINGYNINTLNAVLYVRTGYRDVAQFKEYEDLEE